MLSSLLSGQMDFIDVIIYILSTLTVILLTLPIHEFAHGFAAVKLGDNTPRWQGRMTLNPFAHIDYLGALCILLFGFGWAKPVQVNARNFRKPKRDMAITAFAGPFSNVIVAFVALLICNVFWVIASKTEIIFIIHIMSFFYYIADINVGLAVFNLIPVPPLDGSKILAAFLPDRYYYTLMRYERYIYFLLLILLMSGGLDVPLYYLSNGLMSGLNVITELPFKLLGFFR